MKQSLQLKMGQSLALTPQLQQAIKLLQLSTLDLQQTIEETLESNPLLEREEEDQPREPDADVDFAEAMPETEASDELPVDTRWEDLLPSSAPLPRRVTAMAVSSQNGILSPKRFRTSCSGNSI